MGGIGGKFSSVFGGGGAGAQPQPAWSGTEADIPAGASSAPAQGGFLTNLRRAIQTPNGRAAMRGLAGGLAGAGVGQEQPQGPPVQFNAPVIPYVAPPQAQFGGLNSPRANDAFYG